MDENMVTEVAQNNGKVGVGSAVIIGVSMAAGALLWSKVLTPIGRKIKSAAVEKKAKAQAKEEKSKE